MENLKLSAQTYRLLMITEESFEKYSPLLHTLNFTGDVGVTFTDDMPHSY